MKEAWQKLRQPHYRREIRNAEEGKKTAIEVVGLMNLLNLYNEDNIKILKDLFISGETFKARLAVNGLMNINDDNSDFIKDEITTELLEIAVNEIKKNKDTYNTPGLNLALVTLIKNINPNEEYSAELLQSFLLYTKDAGTHLYGNSREEAVKKLASIKDKDEKKEALVVALQASRKEHSGIMIQIIDLAIEGGFLYPGIALKASTLMCEANLGADAIYATKKIIETTANDDSSLKTTAIKHLSKHSKNSKVQTISKIATTDAASKEGAEYLKEISCQNTFIDTAISKMAMRELYEAIRNGQASIHTTEYMCEAGLNTSHYNIKRTFIDITSLTDTPLPLSNEERSMVMDTLYKIAISPTSTKPLECGGPVKSGESLNEYAVKGILNIGDFHYGDTVGYAHADRQDLFEAIATHGKDKKARQLAFSYLNNNREKRVHRIISNPDGTINNERHELFKALIQENMGLKILPTIVNIKTHPKGDTPALGSK